MHNPLTLFSKRLFLVVSLVGCQILIASAAAAELPKGGDKRPIDRPLSFEAPVPIMDLKAREPETLPASINLLGPRKGEIFHASPLPAVEGPAPSWPGGGLLSKYPPAELTNKSNNHPPAQLGSPTTHR